MATESHQTPAQEQRDLRGQARSPFFLGLSALLVGFLLLAMSLCSTPIDDAYISFRYTDNLLRGNGLVFNAGERVEGYSNLLWVLILSLLCAATGISPPKIAPPLEVALALMCVIAVGAGRFNLKGEGERPSMWDLAAPLMLALNSAFLFWIGKGMEVIFYTAVGLLFARFVVGLRRERGHRYARFMIVGAVGAALALTRPEGLVAPGAVLVALAAADRSRRNGWLIALAVLAAAVVGQFAFRLIYYGPVWPNTYYAKRLPLPVAIASGLHYLKKFAISANAREAWFYESDFLSRLPIWLVCLAAGPFIARRLRHVWPIVLQALALVGVAVYVGGDWMPGFRFILPALPLGFVLLAEGLREMAGDGTTLPRWRRILAPALLLVLVVSETVGLVCMVSSHEFKRWRHHVRNYGETAEWLRRNAPEGSLVALSDIGIISYYNPQLRFIDVLGLTDPHIASLPGYHYLKTDVEYVLRRAPDYVVAMIFVWPDLQLVRPKTRFDREFIERVKEDGSYVRVSRVRGWREGMRGERWVLFEVYRREARKTASSERVRD